jgi:hypothetical protein
MPVSTVRIVHDDQPLLATIAAVLRRHLVARGVGDGDGYVITLALDPAIGGEGYRIADAPGGLDVSGDGGPGLLAGVGRMLRDAAFTGGFTPGPWRGTDQPDCEVRGMYFALHNNFYCLAPQHELAAYIEDLALWGINAICFHMPQHVNPDTPAAQERYAENRRLLQAAKRIGLKVALIKEPNIGFGNEPEALHAPAFVDTDPPRRGTNGARICPSTPDGFRYLSAMLDAYLAPYADIGIDYMVSFPYDSGGCGCAQCWPWGARGYLTISKEFARLTKQYYPESKFVLGTWCYDVLDVPDGEFAGLDAALRAEAPWVDYIMADSHYDFPAWLLEQGAPGDLPIINFAEISMWGRFPWGGYGANPLPERYQRLWNQSKHLMHGGFPYSEGNFEDMNKVFCAQFFWHKDTPVWDTVRAYIAYEFAPEVVDLVSEAIALLERTYPRDEWQRADVLRAYELLQQADALLPERTKTSWRWRMLYLRAVVDFEMVTHDNEVTDRCDAAFDELLAIYHVEHGWICVAPPSRAFKAWNDARMRGEIPDALPPGSDQAMVSEAKANDDPLPPGSDQGEVAKV